MGDDVAATVFSREDRQRYRAKVKRCLDVFARMLSEARFDARPGLDRPRDRAQPHRRGGRSGARQREGARGDRRRRLPDRARAVQRRDQRRPALAERQRALRARARRAHQPQQRRGEGPRRRRAHGDGRDPADGHRPPPQRGVLQRQPALRAAQRADLRRPRRGPRHPHRGRRAARDLRGHDHARGRLHERAAAPAGRPVGVRRALERRAGDRRRPARAGRQLAVLLRQGAVARDAHPALRAGHRHALGGAARPGRAPARVVRRALDHLDLRPLRGERPLLPGAAAGVRGGGPGRGARRRRHPAPAGAAAAQRHDLPLEPADLRRRARPPAPARGEPRAARRARRSSTSSPTRPSTTG